MYLCMSPRVLRRWARDVEEYLPSMCKAPSLIPRARAKKERQKIRKERRETQRAARSWRMLKENHSNLMTVVRK